MAGKKRASSGKVSGREGHSIDSHEAVVDFYIEKARGLFETGEHYKDALGSLKLARDKAHEYQLPNRMDVDRQYRLLKGRQNPFTKEEEGRDKRDYLGFSFVVIILGFIIFFNNITGHVVGMGGAGSNIFGSILIVLGVFLAFFYFKKRS